MKVCVRIPMERREELMAVAATMRGEAAGRRAPGWDAKLIHEIAERHFGGLTGMFEHHGWPERGTRMLPAVQRHVKETYGSIERFETEVTLLGRHRAPSWDAKLIHGIAKQYGGLAAMFKHHGWPERGSDMMRAVQRRVKETYGSTEAFEARHRTGRP